MSSFQYNEDQRDCLQEICNVAMGHAGDSLARKLGVFVTLSIPQIQIIDAQHLSSSLKNFASSSAIYAASQLFASEQGAELSGLALVMLSQDSLPELKILSADSKTDDEIIADICKTLAQTCLDELNTEWDMGFQCQAPQIVQSESLQALCQSISTDWKNILLVEINYQMEGKAFNGDLLLLFPDQAISAMAKRLDELLA